jgi:uncharacterized protein (TIGR03790 family)
MSSRSVFSVAFVFLAILGLPPRSADALDASELALVVNRNMPDGMKLAELYAKTRQVPDHRIIELDLPNSEQMSFEDYERDVVPPIRQFLRLNDPHRHIKCLVTFYGMPFRIAAHVDTREETQELAALRGQLRDVGDQLQSLVGQSEQMATSYDPAFTPLTPATTLVPPENSDQLNGPGIDALARRLDHAGKSMMLSIRQIADPAQHSAGEKQLIALVQRFQATVQLKDSDPTTSGAVTSTTIPSVSPSVAAADPALAEIQLEDRRFDPAARESFRQLAAKEGGLFRYAKLILAQIEYLSPEDSEAATDNELSLLWFTFYPRARWQLNSLDYRLSLGGNSPALMVSRLDGPDPTIVRQMILDSVHAEEQGLQGKVVIDSRGLAMQGPDAAYDDSLRKLGALIRSKTNLQLTFDDKPDVLPPHSVQDVAVYCGWYSVGKYIPCCSFVPGAVGYHMASFEMVTLRDPNNTGWVRGLLNDGVAATVGPVSEPYLQAFPPPNEFFPLLFTGKLTLAEVYWKTELMASWRMCLVGDPLYTPFKKQPALKVTDLPVKLQSIFAQPTTAPTSSPSTK